MKLARVEEAEGMILAHDMTEIIPGKSKYAAFKKGQVITIEGVGNKDNFHPLQVQENLEITIPILL